ncbi:hypothetical protein OGR47_02735 [Methylocystis sp. MJC1]|uniref:hypothetical protein n=1 Tax=Methylocystis sp. MJC1 TaxID=2654282 RepID=UPI0013EBD089|nr:hypothetical protein [Methylocystis sp. MJC1]KAF2991147.1 hypothetical protein MJC1_01880 [Methylocystis sp. MJC1]MBU6525930.1 hypothetical protein [Methylocystis sp. MJC1]UZX12396.1 hypothetical protein OGR47_02735 [Methylocystis sp. MJC1]
MNTIVLLRNVAAYVRNVVASAFVSQTAGAAAAVTGSTIDRLDPNNGALAGSALLSLIWSATLGAANTFSITSPLVQHSQDGANWSTLSTPTAPGVVATGPGGGGTVNGEWNYAQDLTDAYRYVRLNYTPAFSAANTDTAKALTVATLSCGDRAPA